MGLTRHVFGYDFFISYSRSDSSDYARGLHETLVKLGYRVFIDYKELYAGQDATGIGPVFLGSINIGTRKSLNWDGAWRQSSGDSTKF